MLPTGLPVYVFNTQEVQHIDEPACVITMAADAGTSTSTTPKRKQTVNTNVQEGNKNKKGKCLQ
jgi:hypothetical protein